MILFSLLLATPCLILITQVAYSLSTHYTSNARARCVADIMQLICANKECLDDDILNLRHRFSHKTMLAATLYISKNIYGNELYRLASIVELCGVDYRLIRHSTSLCKWKRAYRLEALSHIPTTPATFECAELNIEHNRHLSFYSAMTLISSRPEYAMRYISQLQHDLSLYEVALLAELLRRRSGAIAYTPLLTSENRNLRLLGVYIVQSLLAVDAEAYLQQISIGDDYELALSALHTLCSIRGNIASSSVRHLFNSLPHCHRNLFLRNAVQACYSTRACASLLNSEEYTRLIGRINSYKCRIVCN